MKLVFIYIHKVLWVRPEVWHHHTSTLSIFTIFYLLGWLLSPLILHKGVFVVVVIVPHRLPCQLNIPKLPRILDNSGFPSYIVNLGIQQASIMHYSIYLSSLNLFQCWSCLMYSTLVSNLSLQKQYIKSMDFNHYWKSFGLAHSTNNTSFKGGLPYTEWRYKSAQNSQWPIVARVCALVAKFLVY